MKTIHRLVAEAFLPNQNELLQVNHIDGNKLNNNVQNLEWCTAQYNIQESWRMGLSKPRGKAKIKEYFINKVEKESKDDN